MTGKIGLFIWVVLAAALLILAAPHVGALPTTGAATLVGSNNVTVTSSGAATTCWFEWGMLTDGEESWSTPNQTPVGGVCTKTIKGSPLVGGSVFYYRVCDVTGCGADATFTTAAVTPIPTTTYGAIFDNLTDNQMDITMVSYQATAPYMWLVPGNAVLVWGLLFSFIFMGMWLRGRDVTVPTIVGFLIGSFIFMGNYGLQLGIPGEIAELGQGIMYAAIAGILLSLIKK
jgi:hypothetical protein